mmetsp:Transcript_118097/g.164505  ORF Transcript_118097/g.164505 Transcript_118097/m.164505 type:complete len:96 (+) Transcript_118097:1-288(+)
MQSVSKIVLPATMLLGAVLAYWSYNAFPMGLLPDSAGEESGGFAGNQGGYGYGGTERPAAPPHGGRNTIQAGRVVGGGASVSRPFEGQGQRLGNN